MSLPTVMRFFTGGVTCSIEKHNHQLHERGLRYRNGSVSGNRGDVSSAARWTRNGLKRFDNGLRTLSAMGSRVLRQLDSRRSVLSLAGGVGHLDGVFGKRISVGKSKRPAAIRHADSTPLGGPTTMSCPWARAVRNGRLIGAARRLIGAAPSTYVIPSAQCRTNVVPTLCTRKSRLAYGAA